MVILILALAAGGCASNSRQREEQGYIAGQNAILKEQQDQQNASVTVLGAVQNQHVPWVQGLTLSQAIATANYLGTEAPTKITITRNGETAAIDAKILFQGAVVPLEPGDVIELQ